MIFAIFDPTKSVRPGTNPGLGIPGNGTIPIEAFDDVALKARTSLLTRADYDDGHGGNSVVIIFRYDSNTTFAARRLLTNYFVASVPLQVFLRF